MDVSTTVRPALNFVVSGNSGSFTFNNNTQSAATPTNLSVTITTSGRPVMLKLISGSIGARRDVPYTNNITVSGSFRRGATVLNTISASWSDPLAANGNLEISHPATAFSAFDPVSAGTWTYDFRVSIGGPGGAGNTTTGTATNVVMLVYEL